MMPPLCIKTFIDPMPPSGNRYACEQPTMPGYTFFYSAKPVGGSDNHVFSQW